MRFILVLALLLVSVPFLDAGCGKSGRAGLFGRMKERRQARMMTRGYTSMTRTYSTMRVQGPAYQIVPVQAVPMQAPPMKCQ